MRRSISCAWACKTFACNKMTVGRHSLKPRCLGPGSRHSDLFDLGYEAVGDLDARLELFADWKEPFREGVIYYLKDGRVRGVMLWNVWGQVDAARELIAARGPLTHD